MDIMTTCIPTGQRIFLDVPLLGMACNCAGVACLSQYMTGLVFIYSFIELHLLWFCQYLS